MPTQTVPHNPSQRIKNDCIAITGGVATGKSLVASMLKKIGFTVIDADQLARGVVEPGQETLNKIIKEFGQTILDDHGKLDRAKMRDLVMRNPSKRGKLENIMHPAIQRAFEMAVTNLKLPDGQTFFYEASLVFELGRENLFRECWATYCSVETQIQRLQQRSHLNRQQCLDIIQAQMPAELKASKAKVRIDTEVSISELEENIKNLVKATKA